MERKHGMGRGTSPGLPTEAVEYLRPKIVERSKKWVIEKAIRNTRERPAMCDSIKIECVLRR